MQLAVLQLLAVYWFQKMFPTPLPFINHKLKAKHGTSSDLYFSPLINLILQCINLVSNLKYLEMCVTLLRVKSHREIPVLVGNVEVHRPVLHAHDLQGLEGLGQHDDGGHVLLPDEAPEVGHGGLEGALGHDPRLARLEGGHVAGVDVVVSGEKKTRLDKLIL